MQQIIPPVDTALLVAELEGHLLRPSNKAGNYIYDITAHECPNVMREIARLREISYRDGGGATGNEMDIDDMDTMSKPYHQLIVWDPDHQQIVGGYRYLLGSDAELRPNESGELQPYITSAHLFHYSKAFIREYLPHTIEFGRAFVQPMYQKREMGVKALFALDNIWDGIGALLYNHPEIRWMIGKVTIYPDYNPIARELIYAYLDRYHHGKKDLFKPYRPFHAVLTGDEAAQLIELTSNTFHGDSKQENYHALLHAIREQDAIMPPMFSAYLNLTDDLLFFGNAVNDELANVYETGIMVDIEAVYEEKKNRYINPYIEWIQSQNI
ncbi:MAG: GNAT family N-acetyltransferase [Paludibacteraceae bacterium]|nr:GNAT family N-acetyltransferase [Paludibacteraceae bacterium]